MLVYLPRMPCNSTIGGLLKDFNSPPAAFARPLTLSSYSSYVVLSAEVTETLVLQRRLRSRSAGRPACYLRAFQVPGNQFCDSEAAPGCDGRRQRLHLIEEHDGAANVVKLAGNFLLTAAIEAMAEASACVPK